MKQRLGLGVTLVEALVVLALIGTIVGVASGARFGRWTFAKEVGEAVATARARAVVWGRPVAAITACAGTDDVVAVHDAARRVRGGLVRGLQFTPDGLPRTCDGGGVGNTTILLEQRGRQAAVIVSSLGRVRWELR